MEYFIYHSFWSCKSFANLINRHFPPFVIIWIVWQTFKNPIKIWFVIIQSQRSNWISKTQVFKVEVLWEGHTNLRWWNHHLRFVLWSKSQIYGGDFAKFCGLLRILIWTLLKTYEKIILQSAESVHLSNDYSSLWPGKRAKIEPVELEYKYKLPACLLICVWNKSQKYYTLESFNRSQ